MWATGEAYEPYVGRWSRLVADRFVRETAAPGEAAGWTSGAARVR